MELFEKALKNGLRFKSSRGSLTTEDLFALSLEELDEIAKAVNKQLKASEEESFISTSNKKNVKLETSLEVLKRVIAIKIADRDASKLATLKRQQRAKVLEVMANKQDEALHSKSLEELQAMLDGTDQVEEDVEV